MVTHDEMLVRSGEFDTGLLDGRSRGDNSHRLWSGTTDPDVAFSTDLLAFWWTNRAAG
ncbi:MAG: hypothetical protein J07HX64_01980 [halophilic archaeon J07HX64]|nr:MAG: hypothetical protein J07HX64_01980 [halophilic archaeon J07HX64]